jgi:hypothetical protein
MNTKYTPIAGNDEVADNPLHSGSSSSSSSGTSGRGADPNVVVVAAADENGPTPFVVKVLHKEKSTTVSDGLSAQSTVLDLKLAIDSQLEVPVGSQRLIFAGRPLKPDDKTLASFKVDSGATVHLFPLPPRSLVPSTGAAAANEASSAAAAATATTPHGHEFATLMSLHSALEPAIQYPIYFDPEVSSHGREVRLWSVILVFLSGMTLFNNVSYNLSTGKFGNNGLDVVVSVTETACSAVGLYVAQLGLNSARSMDLPTIRKYLVWLQGLALACILMRIAWVFDVIVQVQEAVAKAKAAGASTGGGGGGGDGGSSDIQPPDNTGIFSDDTALDPSKLTDEVVLSFAFQASMIAFICIAAWLNCVYRARLFRGAVSSYNETNDANSADIAAAAASASAASSDGRSGGATAEATTGPSAV